MSDHSVKDPQQPIELYMDGEGCYYLRIEDRVGHMEKRYASFSSQQEVIAQFHDDADEFLDDDWSLSEYSDEGGTVESFGEWERHHLATREGQPSETAHVATHQA